MDASLAWRAQPSPPPVRRVRQMRGAARPCVPWNHGRHCLMLCPGEEREGSLSTTPTCSPSTAGAMAALPRQEGDASHALAPVRLLIEQSGDDAGDALDRHAPPRLADLRRMERGAGRGGVWHAPCTRLGPDRNGRMQGRRARRVHALGPAHGDAVVAVCRTHVDVVRWRARRCAHPADPRRHRRVSVRSVGHEPGWAR